jgi:heme/copper-type cytochrome/quinol oxidase subunit 3
MKNFKLTVFIIVLIIIFGGFGLFYYLTRPSQSEINSAKTSVVIVPTDILSSSTLNQLNNFKQNGSLPISIGAQEKGRSNPFASY